MDIFWSNSDLVSVLGHCTVFLSKAIYSNVGILTQVQLLTDTSVMLENLAKITCDMQVPDPYRLATYIHTYIHTLFE